MLRLPDRQAALRRDCVESPTSAGDRMICTCLPSFAKKALGCLSTRTKAAPVSPPTIMGVATVVTRSSGRGDLMRSPQVTPA
jgi:hypothetical protein